MPITNIKDFAEACEALGITYVEFQTSRNKQIHEDFASYVNCKKRYAVREYHPDKNKTAEAVDIYKKLVNYSDDLIKLSENQVESYLDSI